MLLIQQLLQSPRVVIEEALGSYASLIKHELQVAAREIEGVQRFHLVGVELLFVWIFFSFLRWR